MALLTQTISSIISELEANDRYLFISGEREMSGAEREKGEQWVHIPFGQGIKHNEPRFCLKALEWESLNGNHKLQAQLAWVGEPCFPRSNLMSPRLTPPRFAPPYLTPLSLKIYSRQDAEIYQIPANELTNLSELDYGNSQALILVVRSKPHAVFIRYSMRLTTINLVDLSTGQLLNEGEISLQANLNHIMALKICVQSEPFIRVTANIPVIIGSGGPVANNADIIKTARSYWDQRSGELRE